MKIAIPLCRNRIAPLFDVAETFLLFDSEQQDSPESLLSIGHAGAREACRQLQQHGVGALLCGALCRVWLRNLAGLGIEVHHGLAGDAHAVLRGFLHDGDVGLENFAMPGCRRGLRGGRQGRRQRRRSFCDFNQFFKE